MSCEAIRIRHLNPGGAGWSWPWQRARKAGHCAEQLVTVSLRSGDLMRVRGAVLRIVDGYAWITLTGDPADYVVSAGGEFTGGKDALVQPLGSRPLQFAVCTAAPGLALNMKLIRRGDTDGEVCDH